MLRESSKRVSLLLRDGGRRYVLNVQSRAIAIVFFSWAKTCVQLYFVIEKKDFKRCRIPYLSRNFSSFSVDCYFHMVILYF